MRIRPASEGDAATVTELWTEGYSGRGAGEGRRAPYEEWEFLDAAERCRLFVAELAGEVAAAGAAALALWSRPYQVEAHRLYGSLGYRRQPARDSSDPEGRRLVFVLDL